MEPTGLPNFGIDEHSSGSSSKYSSGSHQTGDHGARWSNTEEELGALREEAGQGATLLVGNHGNILWLEVKVDMDVTPEAVLSHASLTLSHTAEMDCIRNFLHIFHTLKCHPAALFSSLRRLSGLEHLVLGVSCLTVRWVTEALDFIQNCPSTSKPLKLQIVGWRSNTKKSLCSAVCLTREASSLRLNLLVEQDLEAAVSDIRLTLSQPPESDTGVNFGSFLLGLHKYRHFGGRGQVPEGNLLAYLVRLPGLKTVELRISCLTVGWAACILILIHLYPSVEQLKATEEEWGSHGKEQSFCSSLSVQRRSGSLRLDVNVPRPTASDAAVSNISLTLSHFSDVASSSTDFCNFLNEYYTIRRRTEISPECAALLSSLASLPGLEIIEMEVSCLTVNWAARILCLLTSCPSLKEVQLVEWMKYRQWPPKETGSRVESLCSSLSVKKHDSSLDITLATNTARNAVSLDITLDTDTARNAVQSHISFTLSTSSEVEYTDLRDFLQKLLYLKYSTEQSEEHLESLRSFLHSSPGVGEVDLDFRYIPDPWATVILSLLHTSSTPDEAQQDPPTERQSSLRRSCQSCSGIPDSTHWDLMEPYISMETGVSVYNLSSQAGSYECTVSGLRWVCGGDVTLQYHFSTEELFSVQLEMLQYRPISPLMDIKVLSGELDEIHLPHSLCVGVSEYFRLSDAVRVLHGDDSGVSLEKCELMRFHARLVKPSFSLMEVLVSLGVPVKTHCEVLIYQSYATPLILNTFVVPNASTAKKAIEEKWKSLGFHIEKSPPKESFWINSNLHLSTSCLSRIIPEEISLTYNTSPAYFEVCIKKPDDEFEMELIVAEDRRIWKAAIRKGADYKTAMPTRSADQGGAVSLPTDAEVLPVASSIMAEGASQMSAPALSRNQVQGDLIVTNTFLAQPP